MPEIRELESFEDFEDAIHNSPTKDCFKPPVCLLMLHRLCYIDPKETQHRPNIRMDQINTPMIKTPLNVRILCRVLISEKSCL